MTRERTYRHEFLTFDTEEKIYRKGVIVCTLADAEARHEKAMKGNDEAEKSRTCALLNDLRTQAGLPVPVC